MRHKIALFTPLNPIKSGISDYSEELIFELSKYVDIDIYIARNYKPNNQDIVEQFKIYPFNIDNFDPGAYDEIVFHMGNSSQPHSYMYDAIKEFHGIVVLHDYFLQGFYAERYFATNDFSECSSLFTKYYSKKGEEIANYVAQRITPPIWSCEEAIDYPLNEEIISNSKAIIVHSNFIRNKILETWNKPVITIPHHGFIQKDFSSSQFRKKLGIKEEDLLIGSFGFVNPNKRFDVLIPTIMGLHAENIKYLIVGEDGADILKNFIKEKSERLIILSYSPLDEFEALISSCDICINLRYPTLGETSGSLIRMMGFGKPVLVSNVGAYAELPDYSVYKIDPDIDEAETIRRALNALIQDKEFRESMGREAAIYVKEFCSIKKCAKLYADFIHLNASSKRCA